MTKLKGILEKINVNDWQEISAFLDSIKSAPEAVPVLEKKEFLSLLSTGAAFVTYDFGIDGVSIEIFKYAECLEEILPGIPLHFVGGDFHEKADIVLKDYWKRFEIDGFTSTLIAAFLITVINSILRWIF